MAYATLMEYWLALNAIEAEQQLLRIDVACSPMMKVSKRKELIDRYKKAINNTMKRDNKIKTVADWAKFWAEQKANQDG